MSYMEDKMQERYDALPYLEMEAEIERLTAEIERYRAVLLEIETLSVTANGIHRDPTNWMREIAHEALSAGEGRECPDCGVDHVDPPGCTVESGREIEFCIYGGCDQEPALTSEYCVGHLCELIARAAIEEYDFAGEERDA